jgi:nicotinate-nucleotide adenylyltransferase
VSRIGIIGGTFDPPHNAHLDMARQAKSKLFLEKILFMPAPNPPHKTAWSTYETRVRMVELAVSGCPFMELSRLEEFRSGSSFTVDLLEFYRRSHDDDIYFLMGSDSLVDLASWKDPRRILEMATLVIFRRTGFDPKVPIEGDAAVVLFNEPVMDISSSAIREGFASGAPVKPYLPKKVLDFILDNSLYSC